MTENLADDWVPESCTLPTIDKPLRRSEFDRLFAQDLVGVVRESTRRVRLELRPDPAVAARAADLAAREASCCAFFTFDLGIADGTVSMTVATAAAQQAVLAALADRAESKMGRTT